MNGLNILLYYIYFVINSIIYFLYSNPKLLRTILLLILIVPTDISIVFLSLFYKDYKKYSTYIPKLYVENIANISKEENLYIYNKNNTIKKTNKNVIIYIHGGAGIFKFPSIYAYKIFDNTIPNNNLYDKYYISYPLAYNINNYKDMINSVIVNLQHIFNLQYDKYIIFSDSMGGSLAYYSLLQLYNTHYIKNKFIYTYLISPYIYIKLINKDNNSHNDYITSYIFNTYLNNEYNTNIAYIGNPAINIDITKEMSEDIVNYYNIKIYYSDSEFLAPSIKHFIKVYNIPNIIIKNSSHCEFFYLMNFIYNNEENSLIIDKNKYELIIN